jgi:ABC-2 type transport system permease protein
MIYLRIVWTIFILQLKQTILDGFVLFTVIVQPIIVALLAIYMLRDTQGFQAIYVIVGSALTGLWSGTIYLASRGVEAERWSGTLEETIGSPTPLAIVVMGKGLASMALSLCSMLFSYPIAAFAFGFRLTISEPILFVASLVLTVVAFIAMALVISPIFALNPGSSTWSNPLEFLIYALSGFLFPIALLPIALTPISYALSPYWAARALHLTSSGGGSIEEVWLSWGFLILSSVIYCFVAVWLFRVMLSRARIEATLGLQ